MNHVNMKIVSLPNWGNIKVFAIVILPFNEGKSYLTGQSRQIIASLTGQSRQIIASLTGLSRQIICYLTGPYNQKSGPYYKVYRKLMASLTGL